MRRTRDLYSLELGSVAALGSGFGSSVPIDGSGLLTEIHFQASPDAVAFGHLQFQLYLTTIEVTSSAELFGGEPLFPFIIHGSGNRSSVWISPGLAPTVLRGPFAVAANGRRISCEAFNGATETCRCVFYFVYERVGVSQGRRKSDVK